MTETGSHFDPALDDIASDWVARLAAGAISKEEVADLNAWLGADLAHRRAFARARAHWQGLAAVEADLYKLRERVAPRRGMSAALTGAVSVAACLTLALLLEPLLPNLFADHHTVTGEVARTILPDGSVVWLDSASALDVRFSERERRVALLSGRAWFDVKHDASRPFRVKTESATVTDIGTAFSLEVRPGAYGTVAVDRGAVRIEWQGRQLALRGGEATEWNIADPPASPHAHAPVASPDWTRGRLTLEHVPLSAALAEIARYHAGQILLLDGAAAKRSVSGELYLDRLDDGLDALAMNQGLHVLRLPYLVVVYGG